MLGGHGLCGTDCLWGYRGSLWLGVCRGIGWFQSGPGWRKRRRTQRCKGAARVETKGGPTRTRHFFRTRRGFSRETVEVTGKTGSSSLEGTHGPDCQGLGGGLVRFLDRCARARWIYGPRVRGPPRTPAKEFGGEVLLPASVFSPSKGAWKYHPPARGDKSTAAQGAGRAEGDLRFPWLRENGWTPSRMWGAV